ncbi:unnamed protein product [Polarella glacialis]|uniref:Palmitoyl-protein hydrolase n=1 Tax=Polarella glacialis TaxID=89957 RepID=A0A813I3E0_POLGL|nr:unnamed protein product [Polarella glacialis]CAE8644513.1 unnamed protein product [Polarella glacialis]
MDGDFFTSHREAKLPIVVLPGTMSTCAQMGDLLCMVLKVFGNDCNSYTDVAAFLPFELVASVVWDMRAGLRSLHKFLKSDPKYKDGFNLLAFSQGNCVARAYLQLHNDPPAKIYLSVHGPLAGEFFPIPGGAEVCHLIPPFQKFIQWCHYVYSPMSRQLFKSGVLLDELNAQSARES